MLIPEQIELYNAELDRLSDEELTKEIADKQKQIAHILCLHYEWKPTWDLIEPIHPKQLELEKEMPRNYKCEAIETCKANCFDCIFN